MATVTASGARDLFSGAFARRLFILFVAAAMLPLAISDGLSGVAVTRLIDDNYARDQSLMTAEVSRQVYDRLMTGKTLISTFFDYDGNGSPFSSAGAGAHREVPGLHIVFQSVARLAANGDLMWTSDPAAELGSAWRSSSVPEMESASTGGRAPAPRIQIGIRITASTPVRILMGASTAGGDTWVAELTPDFLWSPIYDAGSSSLWRISDSQGRVIVHFDGEDLRGGETNHEALQSRDFLQSTRVLFLQAEFRALDWRFEQWSPRPRAQWLGTGLHVWLALVAAGTLLSITLVISWQIRKTLVPLEELRLGTQGLAAGSTHTRVSVEGDDEFAELAGAFNDMAGRIEAQFAALSDLAAIDNDILAGKSIRRVADRILRQIRSSHPDSSAVVGWLDAEGRLNLVSDRHPASDGPASSEPYLSSLSRDALARFIGLADDALYPGVSADPAVEPDPWWAPLVAGKRGSIAVLPVCADGRALAVISLFLAAPQGMNDLQTVRELRDRLAVAFAAWSREYKLSYRATHDGLTGLANRSGLHDFLDESLRLAAVNETTWTHKVAVLFIDLDRFKSINDALGHDAGDELLCLAAQRLRQTMPAGSMLARQGGDEFVAVIPQCGEAQASSVAAQIVQSLAQPFELRDAPRVLGASVGIALAPRHGQQRDSLMRRADMAMYAAKEAGRSRFAIFSEDLDIRARDRLRIQSELPSAILDGQLVAYFQPRVRASDLSITSAEALVRWRHPKLGLLLPGAFLSHAEDNDLIIQLGDWMLDQAVERIAHWRMLGAGIGRVSVNVSTRQLMEGRLLEKVTAVLDRHSLPARHLELEVTESVMIGDSDRAGRQLAHLRELGVTIAMDDFGTGYSSMANLRDLPIDVMKVDRAFVKDLDEVGAQSQGALAIVKAIVAMAHSLRLGLVAEGIETPKQAEILCSLGCDELQGFLYGYPEPAADFEGRLFAVRSPDVAAPFVADGF